MIQLEDLEAHAEFLGHVKASQGHTGIQRQPSSGMIFPYFEIVEDTVVVKADWKGMSMAIHLQRILIVNEMTCTHVSVKRSVTPGVDP